MVDLHCHLLPGVDDGPRDLAAALALARASAENGITHAILTPHVYPGQWPNSRTLLEPRFDAMARAVADAGIPLRMTLAAEVRLTPQALDMLDADELPMLGVLRGQRVLLLELPESGIPVGAINAIDHLVSRGITPMIAHPERNRDFEQSWRKALPFIDAGCLLQLTAASVCGWFGKRAHRSALELLDAGLVFAVATDAHNLTARPPILAEGRQAISSRLGPEVADLLTRANPSLLIRAVATS